MRPCWGLRVFLGNCSLQAKSHPHPVVPSPYGRSLLTAHVSVAISPEEEQVWVSIAFCCSFLQSQCWNQFSDPAAKGFLSYQCWCCPVSLMVRAVHCHNQTLNTLASAGVLCVCPKGLIVTAEGPVLEKHPCHISPCCSWPPRGFLSTSLFCPV